MFDDLRLKNICHLISVLCETNLEMRSLIKERYNSQGTHYDETFLFLQNVTGIKDTVNGIRVNNVFNDLAENIDEKEIANKILLLIQEKKSPYRDELFKYLSKFNLDKDELTYQPSDLHRTEFSDVRNFLIEAGVVEYRSATDKYIIVPEQIHLYALAQETTKVVTPNVLKRCLARKDQLGREAEIAILKYEKARVGKAYENYVTHVALKNEAAGYDIKSITKIEGDQIENRYIEVKAVSPDTYRFYWTKNEMKVADLLKTKYFIYLLPVNPNKNFSFYKLKIIPDPITAILDSSDTWNVETDIVCCNIIN